MVKTCKVVVGGDHLVELVGGNPHPGALPKKTTLSYGQKQICKVLGLWGGWFCLTWPCNIGSDLDYFLHL